MKQIRLGLIALVFAVATTACDAASITSTTASDCDTDGVPTMGSGLRTCP